MKVALISFLFGVEQGGGAGAAVKMLADGLLKRGFKVVVITTHAKKQISVERIGNLTIYRFFPKNLYWIGEKDLQPTWKKVGWQLLDTWNPFVFQVIRRILFQEQPNLIHIHKLRGLSPSIWAAAKSVGISAMIQTCHDYELVSPQGTLTGRVGTWARQKAWFLRPYQHIRAKLSQTVTAVTAPSQYVLDIVTDYNFFNSAYHSVVPNSHGFTQAQVEQSKIRRNVGRRTAEKKFDLLYLGRLETEKGVDILCEAFNGIAAEFPNLRLNIAGWGTLEKALKKQYGQHPQIVFPGAVFGKNKSRLFETSDILIVPSIWPEAFGIVIIEAFAYGLPIIATNSGGIPELVEEGKTGFLIPPADALALAQILQYVIKVPEEISQMTSACFMTSQLYTVEQVTQGYISIYERVSHLAIGSG